MNARIHADRSATPDLRTEDDFSLPGWIYRDPEFFELEKQRIFKNGLAARLPRERCSRDGRLPDLRLPGESILTVRGDDGACAASTTSAATALAPRGRHARQLRPAHHLPLSRLDLPTGRPPRRRAACARTIPASTPSTTASRRSSRKSGSASSSCASRRGCRACADMMAPYAEELAAYPLEDVKPLGQGARCARAP